MKRGLLICVMMMLNYTLIAANMRYVARGNYLGTIATDAIIALVGWQLVRWVAEAKSWTDRAFYVVGAMMGGVLGIWLT